MEQRHQYFFPEPKVMSSGVSGWFFVKSNSEAISGKLIASEFEVDTLLPAQNPHRIPPFI
jgi:hypothetical protein